MAKVALSIETYDEITANQHYFVILVAARRVFIDTRVTSEKRETSPFSR